MHETMSFLRNICRETSKKTLARSLMCNSGAKQRHNYLS
uniref:Uncharacterized protein n=1 Tax=Rhizophora mucronata TaxID=61149 RepID=A0A2P2P8D8_RHIMU